MPLLHPNMRSSRLRGARPADAQRFGRHLLVVRRAIDQLSAAARRPSNPVRNRERQSYFDTEWVAYPTGGPPAISLSLFLGYAQSVGAAGKLLLDRHGLPSPAQVALSWLTPEAPGVSDKAWVVPPGVAPAQGNLSLPSGEITRSMAFPTPPRPTLKARRVPQHPAQPPQARRSSSSSSSASPSSSWTTTAAAALTSTYFAAA